MSNPINGLITEAKDQMQELAQRSRHYASKWEKTGLLEGLKGSSKSYMSVLLENQAAQLLKESSTTNGAGAEGEQWSGVALPLVRKVFGEIAAKEFVSVQPMNLPSGLVFYLEFEYGTANSNRTVGESVYGDTTSSLAPQGGLYGTGRFGYSINHVTASGLTAVTSSAGSSGSVNWESGISPASVVEITVPFSVLPGVDKTAISSFVPSGSAWSVYFPQFTRLSADQSGVVFVVVGNGTSQVNSVSYSKQPTESDRGDFEDRVGTSIPPTGVNLNIPEINIELRREPIVAKTRKLKAVWSPELAQDLNAYHSIDAEAEVTAILSEHIALEIDLEILSMLLTYAKTTDYWSANIGEVWTGSSFVQSTYAGTAWTSNTWYQTLGNKMQKVSNEIHRLTLRGGANFAVVSPTVATILETIPGFTPKTDGNQSSFAMGVTQVGSYQNRFTIYKNPYIKASTILMGFRGSSFLETGAVYAPYVPLVMTPMVYDPENFTPRRAVLTRYAKKMLRPEFYARLICKDIEHAI